MGETIRMYQAWYWDCPKCHKRSFEEGVPAEMTPEEIESIKKKIGLTNVKNGDFVVAPANVKCKKCKKAYEVQVDVSTDYI